MNTMEDLALIIGYLLPPPPPPRAPYHVPTWLTHNEKDEIAQGFKRLGEVKCCRAGEGSDEGEG